jgi:threonine dehydratase
MGSPSDRPGADPASGFRAADVSFADVGRAARRLRGAVHRTPVLTGGALDEDLASRGAEGASVFLKAEHLQKVGAFKARGARNAVGVVLEDVEAGRRAMPPGFLTHSSGNHGAALAWAARDAGCRCTVVVPDDAPAVKKAAMASYGAELVECPRPERDAVCAELAASRGLEVVPPFDDPRVIAGQGTAALELLEDVGRLDVVIASVGGGGLLSGTTITVRGLLGENARVIGAEPLAVDDAARSLATGELQPTVHGAKTRCDGLMTALSQRTFAILRAGGTEVRTVDEDAILDAGRYLVSRTKQFVEPSAAVTWAVARALAPELAGLRVGVILTGGNASLDWLAG